MKKVKTILACALLAIQLISFSNAQDLQDFFNSSDAKVTWLGVDFSEVRTYGDVGAGSTEIKERYTIAINDIIITESDKYNLAEAFRKSSVSSDLGAVSKANAKMDADKILTTNLADLNRLDAEKVATMVASYSLPDKPGYGVVFIMESMNKREQNATMFVTVIDMSSKKVLLAKRMIGHPGGFGFRNYWARTVYEVLNKIKKTEFKNWQKAELKK